VRRSLNHVSGDGVLKTDFEVGHGHIRKECSEELVVGHRMAHVLIARRQFLDLEFPLGQIQARPWSTGTGRFHEGGNHGGVCVIGSLPRPSPKQCA
jgi:hypothetical protein